MTPALKPDQLKREIADLHNRVMHAATTGQPLVIDTRNDLAILDAALWLAFPHQPKGH